MTDFRQFYHPTIDINYSLICSWAQTMHWRNIFIMLRLPRIIVRWSSQRITYWLWEYRKWWHYIYRSGDWWHYLARRPLQWRREVMWHCRVTWKFSVAYITHEYPTRKLTFSGMNCRHENLIRRRRLTVCFVLTPRANRCYRRRSLMQKYLNDVHKLVFYRRLRAGTYVLFVF